jgi:general secretion pathway protein C
MSPRSALRYVNIILALAAFPAAALLVNDYLGYRYRPVDHAGLEAQTQSAMSQAAFLDYAPVVESQVFPGRQKRLTQIDLVGAEDQGGQRPGLMRGDIELVGTYVGPVSYAIFAETATGAQEVFGLGSTVFSRGVLRSVGDEQAVISSGSRDVSFFMSKDSYGGATRVQARGPSPDARQPRAPQAQPGGAAGRPALTRSVGENEWVIDREAMLDSLKNIGQVLTEARLTPRLADGKVEGFMVTEIKPRGVFNGIGLKNGDVLTRINGYDIDSPEKAMQVLSGIKGETAIDLDIKRGGQNMSLHYQIQ